MRIYKFDPIPFRANRPFFYYLQEDGIVLFAGSIKIM